MDISPKEDLVLNDACNTQNMSLAIDCDLITVDLGDQIRTTFPSAKDDLVINDGVIQSKDLNKSEELSSKVEEVLRSMESMRVVNMAWDEQIDKILESISRIETMISQLSLNNDFETPTKLSVQKTCPFSNRLKAKSLDIDIHTTISDDEDDLIELDKRSFIHNNAFKIEINMDNPVSPTIRATTKKKNISKGKTTMGTQKKLPFNPPGGIRNPKIESKSSNKSKVSYALSQSTSGNRRPILELTALRCTDDQSDVSFKTTWQLSPRFVLEDHDIRMITVVHLLRSRINHKKSQIIASTNEFWNMHTNHEM
ncbi:hypothetical protein S245_037081 [Arachis hypogaea]